MRKKVNCVQERSKSVKNAQMLCTRYVQKQAAACAKINIFVQK